MFWVWGGRGVFSVSETVYAMRLPMWLLAFFGISQSWLHYTRFAAAEWRRSLVVAVNAAGLVLAIFLVRGGRFPGRGYELGSDPGQADGDPESDGRRSAGAGLWFYRPGACGGIAQIHTKEPAAPRQEASNG